MSTGRFSPFWIHPWFFEEFFPFSKLGKWVLLSKDKSSSGQEGWKSILSGKDMSPGGKGDCNKDICLRFIWERQADR